MTVSVALTSFMKSGQIGAVSLGDPIEAVFEELGPPKHMGSPCKGGLVLKYGRVQVYAKDGLVDHMTIKLGPSREPEIVNLIEYESFPRALDDCLAFLRKSGVDLCKEESISFDGVQNSYCTEHGTRVIFDEEGLVSLVQSYSLGVRQRA